MSGSAHRMTGAPAAGHGRGGEVPETAAGPGAPGPGGASASGAAGRGEAGSGSDGPGTSGRRHARAGAAGPGPGARDEAGRTGRGPTESTPEEPTPEEPTPTTPPAEEAEEVVEGEIVGDTEANAAEAVEEDIEDLVVAARRERDEYLDALRRVQADFENYRKRVQRQQEELLARAAEQLVTVLLPALDAFDLAIAHLAGDEHASPSGLLQAAALLGDTLAKEGLEKVAQVGEAFDPTTHEAVEHVPAPPPHTADEAVGAATERSSGPVVAEVLRPGYRWKGRVIRPAMVKVQG